MLGGQRLQAQKSPNVAYSLSMPEPHTHYFEVEMTLSGVSGKHQDIVMPVWAPGSYLVREFAKSVEDFRATGKNEKPLHSEKINKNTWRVNTKGEKKVQIRYKVYAFESSVRTSFLDSSHGTVSGTSVFMFAKDFKNAPVTLTVVPFNSWNRVDTGLQPVAGKSFTYRAENYDILADSPIEIGKQRQFNFNSRGTRFNVSMYGEAYYDENKLKTEMIKVVNACEDVFGSNPNKDYTFLVQNLTHSSGGLEHLNSTLLQVNRWTYSSRSGLQGFLGLVAHEYFHLWNVKRLRPKALGPFDYNNENYTKQLWVSEGITSYYDDLILARTGIYTENEYLSRLSSGISAIENQPGQRVQSLAMASFDAWIKAYRPNENSYNTTISYYSKGSVAGALLDLAIIDATNGKKKLDDVMRYLYKNIYQKSNRGFTEEDFQKAVNKIAGRNMQRFFDKVIYSTEKIDFNQYFEPIGLQLKDRNKGFRTMTLGASLNESGG
ncbi:MAG: peptidase M61, partial [Cytophagales bacterium]|nr:peptidase M61 [Cytophagales bacterium]